MARILIIEDNPANLELMVYLLESMGHEVTTASDGEGGIAAARRSPPPELVLCDIHLPGIDGYGVCRALRKESFLEGVPLIAVTALAMVGDREKALAAGFDGYISKPINPRQFGGEVLAFLGSEPVPTLQVEARAASGPSASNATGTPAPGGARILVVEDNPANSELIVATLVPCGFHVSVATCLAEAKTALAGQTFDLILSDVHLPDGDGLGLLAFAKGEPSLRDVPFIVITATSWGLSIRSRALSLGASSFLIRPIAPQRLLGEVMSHLAERRPPSHHAG